MGDLWADITSDDTEHYIGFIVLKNNEADIKKLDVIDGQQRLATVTIIILAALDILRDYINTNQNINKEEEEERLKDLVRDYIGRKDNTSRTLYNKLVLNKANGDFFKNLCKNKTNLTNDVDIPHQDTKLKSNKYIEKAFDNFHKKLLEYFKQEINGEKISSFIETMTEKLFFTVLYVSSDANAYTLFETLNARGVKLAAVDLLKNFLYAKVSDNQDHLLEMQNYWQ